MDGQHKETDSTQEEEMFDHCVSPAESKEQKY